MSEAGEAPFNSMTSGATMNKIVSIPNLILKRTDIRTPIRRPSDIVLDLLHGTEVQRHTKVRQLDIASFGSQNIRCFQVTVHNLKRDIYKHSKKIRVYDVPLANASNAILREPW